EPPSALRSRSSSVPAAGRCEAPVTHRPFQPRLLCLCPKKVPLLQRSGGVDALMLTGGSDGLASFVLEMGLGGRRRVGIVGPQPWHRPSGSSCRGDVDCPPASPSTSAGSIRG